MAYRWPGNVRELENAVERALIISRDRPLTFHDIDDRTPSAGRFEAGVAASGSESLQLDEIMAHHIRRVLRMCRGRVEGPRGAAACWDFIRRHCANG